METSLMVTDYPEPVEPKEKCYQFEFKATISGYGIVYAESVEKALEKVNKNDYDDIIDTYDMKIEDVTRIEED